MTLELLDQCARRRFALHRARAFVRAATMFAITLTASCGGESDVANAGGTAHAPEAAVPDEARKGGNQTMGEGEYGGGSERGEHAEGAATQVTLTKAAYATARIAVAPVISIPAAASGVGLVVPGQVELDPRRVALVSSRIAGRIERLAVVEGDRVRAGQSVAFLYSPEFLVAQADLAQATRRAQLLSGTEDEHGARALVDAARRRLRLMGAAEADVDRAAAGGEPATTLALRAPIAGSVIEAHLLPGAAVEPGAPIFTVADLSVIDVVAEVPEPSLPLVRTGQRASVGIAAFPAMRFDGEVERLRDALNPETRTVRAVIHVPNGGRRLRPGMFATVQLDVATGDALALAPGGSKTATEGVRGTDGSVGGTLLTIPESALVTDGERRFVFVEVGPRSYERREVRVASLAPPGSSTPRAPAVVVQDGLRAGELVVVSGAFTLKSELAKASLSDDH
ncbi:efflux RND transporter periplasmic adaptor subunit [Gemmatimonas sp.]